MVRKRTGRRPGITLSRQAILRSAQAKFGAYGFEKASIRSIAQDAGVDAALIHHFFLSKEGLFAASIHDALHPEKVVEEVLSASRAEIGARLVRAFLRLWEGEETAHQMRSILRSAVSHDRAARMLREFIMREVLVPIATEAGQPRPETRASLAASQLIGMALTRYIVEMQPIASLSGEELVEYVGPVMQGYLAGELPAGR